MLGEYLQLDAGHWSMISDLADFAGEDLRSMDRFTRQGSWHIRGGYRWLVWRGETSLRANIMYRDQCVSSIGIITTNDYEGLQSGAWLANRHRRKPCEVDVDLDEVRWPEIYPCCIETIITGSLVKSWMDSFSIRVMWAMWTGVFKEHLV